MKTKTDCEREREAAPAFAFRCSDVLEPQIAPHRGAIRALCIFFFTFHVCANVIDDPESGRDGWYSVPSSFEVAPRQRTLAVTSGRTYFRREFREALPRSTQTSINPRHQVVTSRAATRCCTTPEFHAVHEAKQYHRRIAPSKWPDAYRCLSLLVGGFIPAWIRENCDRGRLLLRTFLKLKENRSRMVRARPASTLSTIAANQESPQQHTIPSAQSYIFARE